MSELLITHAKKHLWQSPNQDHQFNIGLARLTKAGGFIGSTKVLWHRVLNPTRDDAKRYFHHVYQVGQVSPITLNLADILPENTWVEALGIVDEYNLLIEVYFESGAVVPLSLIWIMRDYKKNLLLCIRHQLGFDYGVLTRVNEFSDEVNLLTVNADNDRLITRFYTNAVGSSLAYNATSTVMNDTVGSVSKVITQSLDWGKFTLEVNELKSKFGNKGAALWYKDGFLVNTPRAYHSDMLGHRYSVVWDETYKFRQFFELRYAPVFKSAKDVGYNKYLLVCDAVYDEIDFFDDVDFYLVVGNELNFKGVYINRAFVRYLRQVTHNGYAIDAALIRSYVSQHAFLGDIDKCKIMVQARKGGMVRPVFSQANRIDELFRLPYPLVMAALYNVNALVPEWSARELENSAYINLMSAKERDITPELARDAYGYTGVVNALMHPRQPIVNGKVKLPSALCIPDSVTGRGCRTLFIYNEAGILIGTLYSESLDDDIDVSSFTLKGMVECFRLRLCQSGQKASFYHNQDLTLPRLKEYGFACYVTGEKNGRPSGFWIDVTGTTFYTFANGKISWNWRLLTDANLYPCVRLNDDIIVNDIQVVRDAGQGYLSVTVEALQDFFTMNRREQLQIPVATVDVFVNGEYMIEGVDYYLGDNYPNIVIVNTWANNLPTCRVIVRAYGVGNPETNQPYVPVEVGFVTEGLLSQNGTYDVSKYRPNSVVVNSRLVDNHKYKFSEYGDGVLYPVDGRPYMIRDYILPTEHVVPGSSKTLYHKMRDIDKRVGGYLTAHVLQPVVVTPKVITERWSVISPVCAGILDAMTKGYMEDGTVPGTFTLGDIDRFVKPYLSLLAYDPAALNADERYVYIRPHALSSTISVTVTQWRFLNLVNDLYLNGRIDFTTFVTIG